MEARRALFFFLNYTFSSRWKTAQQVTGNGASTSSTCILLSGRHEPKALKRFQRPSRSEWQCSPSNIHAAPSYLNQAYSVFQTASDTSILLDASETNQHICCIKSRLVSQHTDRHLDMIKYILNIFVHGWHRPHWLLRTFLQVQLCSLGNWMRAVTT